MHLNFFPHWNFSLFWGPQQPNFTPFWSSRQPNFTPFQGPQQPNFTPFQGPRQLLINVFWRGEAKQESGKWFHSPNWGTLGLPQQTEEHYFTVHCTLYIVHCKLYTVHCTLFTVHSSQPIFQHNFPHNFLQYFSTQIFLTIFNLT